MDAEFIVVEGPQLGNRYPLGTQEVRVGQAPSAEIQLTGNQVAWEHCVVRPRDGRYQIADRRSGTGVYINGMRAKEHWLEAGDQVSIGETVLVFREDPAAAGTAESDSVASLRLAISLSSACRWRKVRRIVPPWPLNVSD